MLIAEISSNHQRDLTRCLDFVSTAKRVGFDAIKFQAFKIDKLFTPEVLELSAEHRRRKDWEFPLEFLPEIRQKCDELDIKLGITPFYLEAVEQCAPYLDFFKVASYELLWRDLHQAVAKSKLPVIISSGMANMQELIEAKQVYLSNNFDLEKLSVLHCVSCYPATVESVNLRAIEAIRIELGCNVGWSDHTCDKDVILSALFVHGAKIIELHFDLDSFGAEANLGHCWLPDDVVALKKTMEKYRSMSGSGTKEPSNAELVERSWRADPKDGLRPISAIRGNLNLR